MPKLNVDTIKRIVQFAAQRGCEDQIPQVAGSLTFTTLFAIVPLVTVAFVLFTAFPMFGSFEASLQRFLAQHLMPEQINNQIFDYLAQFTQKAKGLTTAGLMMIFVTSVMTMMTIESAFNVIWRVPKPRPLAQRMLVYWAIITLGPLLIGISLSTTTYLFTHSSALTGSSVSSVIEWILTSAALPLAALAFTLLYMYLPNCLVRWRDAVIGGVCAAIAFEAAKHGFGYYIRRVPTYTAVYGAFATIPIFLLWVYLSWLITLAGATLVSALPAMRAGEFNRRRYVGEDLLDALGLLACLHEARSTGRSGYTAIELARTLRCDLDTVTRIIAKLSRWEWVTSLDNDGDTLRYVFIRNTDQITVGHLFEGFVLDRAQLEDHLRLEPIRVDRAALLNALSNDKLNISLAELLPAGSIQKSARR